MWIYADRNPREKELWSVCKCASVIIYNISVIVPIHTCNLQLGIGTCYLLAFSFIHVLQLTLMSWLNSFHCTSTSTSSVQSVWYRVFDICDKSINNYSITVLHIINNILYCDLGFNVHIPYLHSTSTCHYQSPL